MSGVGSGQLISSVENSSVNPPSCKSTALKATDTFTIMLENLSFGPCLTRLADKINDLFYSPASYVETSLFTHSVPPA